MHISPSHPPPSWTERLCNLLTVCIFVYAFARIAVVVFASPIVGYANNYDFIRSSTCTGVWMTKGGKPAEIDSRSTSNEVTYTGAKDRQTCMRSVDNLFPRVVRAFHAKGDAIDLREIALARFVVLALAVLCLWCCVGSPPARLAMGVAFLLSLADMGVLPYFNSMYLEFSVVAGGFFSLAIASWWSATATPPARGALLFAATMLLWLGLSKNQYSFLASAIAVYLAWLLVVCWRRPGPAVAFVALALAIPLTFSQLNDKRLLHMQSVAHANTANTLLDAVLPAAHDPVDALARLGLPASCQPAIGFGWFTLEFQNNNRCPEVFEVSRWKLLGLFLHDPRTFHMPLTIGTLKARPLYPHHLGMYEDPATAEQWPHRFIAATSLAPAYTRLPDIWYFYGSLTLTGLSLLAGVAVLALGRVPAPRYHRWRLGLAMFAIGGAVNLYAIASSVFGDGYSDSQKHAVGMVVGLAFQAVGLASLVVAAVAAGRKRRCDAAAQRAALTAGAGVRPAASA